MNAHVQIEHAECLPRINKVERNFLAHMVIDDHDAPLFKAGDYVVADTMDTMPIKDGMFLVEWCSGRRSLMETRPRACEFAVRDGREVFEMRKDGPDTVWYFDPIVRPRSQKEMWGWIKAGRMVSTSDGPYRLEHMQPKIVGKVVGVAVGAATEWAERQVGEYNIAIDRQARKAAESFDADLLIDLRDRTGQVNALMVRPAGSGILAIMVDHDSAEADRIYKEYDAIFRAELEGRAHSRAKLAAALRKAGRVMTLRDGHWHPDPRMPTHVRAVHCPAIEEAAA